MIDLHIHTSHSVDARDEPLWVLGRARELGLAAISITDHSTLDGWRSVRDRAREFGVELVPGTEVGASYTFRGHILELHILGFYFHDETPIDQLGKRQHEVSAGYLEVFFDGLREIGVDITRESVAREFPCRRIGSTAVRAQMRSRGYAKGLVESSLLERRAISAVVDPALREALPFDEVLAGLLETGGTILLAHPMKLLSAKYGALSEDEVLAASDEMLARGLHGVEVWNSGLTAVHAGQLLKFARERGIPISGGTDSHDSKEGKSKIGTLPVPDWVLDTLKRHQRGEDPWEGVDAAVVGDEP